MDLPQRQHGQTLSLDNEPLVIVVESAGEGRHDLRVRLEGPWDPIHSVEALLQFLRKHKAGELGSSGLFTENHPIHIQPTGTTRWDHTLAVYNAAARANYTNITLDEPS